MQLGDGTTNDGSIWGNIIDNATVVFANNASQTYGGTLSGSGTLTKTGNGTLTLTATRHIAAEFDRQRCQPPIGSRRRASLAAPTVLVGMDVTLSTTVADPFDDCTGVSFYMDTNSGNQIDSGYIPLGNGDYQGNGVYSITLPTLTAGWAPGAYMVFAQATFASNSYHSPAATTASADVNVSADAAVIGPGVGDYQESGARLYDGQDPGDRHSI